MISWGRWNRDVLADSADSQSGIKVNSKRPVNLDITTIKLPITAYTSILHRVSGVFLFIILGMLLYGLELSLSSEASFNTLKERIAQPWVKFLVWVTLSAFIYHLIAGIKHLLMDIDIGDGKESGRIGAMLTLLISFMLIILAGVWLW